jgi:hypothetical protein
MSLNIKVAKYKKHTFQLKSSNLLISTVFRKDDKSFAAVSIRRRREKGKCPPNFLNGNWAKNHTIEESVPLIPLNFGTTDKD